MEIKQYLTRDRSEWPSGEWDNEPDKMQWPDPETGLPCLAVRGPFGSWCGYVGVPEDHPYFGKCYGDLDNLAVHGGLTFADVCQPGEESHSICHVPGSGESDRVHWLGFDCAHGGDLTPLMRFDFSEETYRTLEYVQMQCAFLAQQVAHP